VSFLQPSSLVKGAFFFFLKSSNSLPLSFFFGQSLHGVLSSVHLLDLGASRLKIAKRRKCRRFPPFGHPPGFLLVLSWPKGLVLSIPNEIWLILFKSSDNLLPFPLVFASYRLQPVPWAHVMDPLPESQFYATFGFCFFSCFLASKRAVPFFRVFPFIADG